MIEPFLRPDADGAKVTIAWQLAPAGSDGWQVDLKVKSPDTARLSPAIVFLVLLRIENAEGALKDPLWVLKNETLAGRTAKSSAGSTV